MTHGGHWSNIPDRRATLCWDFVIMLTLGARGLHQSHDVANSNNENLNEVTNFYRKGLSEQCSSSFAPVLI